MRRMPETAEVDVPKEVAVYSAAANATSDVNVSAGDGREWRNEIAAQLAFE
jgi:hypothetical protein